MSELSPFSRDLLARSRAERTPSGATRERVFHAVAATGALGAATAVAAPSLLGKLGSLAGKWWLLGGVCVALVGGGARLAFKGATVTKPAVTVVAHQAARLDATQPHAAQPSVVAPSEQLSQDPAAVTTTTPSSVRERPTTAPRFDSVGSQLEQEVSLLHAAHNAYGAGRPEQALALLAQHRSRFPRSQLTSERAILEVLALCRVGRVADAQRLAGKLRGHSKTSVALSGLEGSCAARE